MITYQEAKRAAEKHFNLPDEVTLMASEMESAWLFGTRMTLPNGHAMSVPGVGTYAVRKDTGEGIRINGTAYAIAKSDGDRDGYGRQLAAKFGMTFPEFVTAMSEKSESVPA